MTKKDHNTSRKHQTTGTTVNVSVQNDWRWWWTTRDSSFKWSQATKLVTIITQRICFWFRFWEP